MARSSISGLRRTLRQIQAIPEAVREARNESLEEWAENVKRDAQRLAPVRTGRLRNSIDKRLDLSRGDAVVGTFDRNIMEYAPHVEHGTSSMRAQPHLRPAYEMNRRDAVSDIRDRVRNRLREI